MTAASAPTPQILPQDQRTLVSILVIVPAIWVGLFLAKTLGGLPVSGGELIVIAVRLVLPLIILRYWLVGGIIAMLIDAGDVILIDLLGLGGFGNHYAETDKLLDSYYYVLELVVALRWANPWMRIPTALLFVHRLIGAVIFEFTGAHVVLFIFPNLFENWWLYCVVVMKWFPSIIPGSWKSTLIPLALLLIPKMAQEYLLHYAEAHPWDWTKHHILSPIGIDL